MTAVGKDASRTDLALGYMPQLDGLRAVAVFAVFAAHFLPRHGSAENLAPWGWLGVRLFFVLSGFLITGILVSCRHRAEAEQLPPLTVARNFYIRRFLRLFPIYYLYLFVSFIALPDSRVALGWFLPYAQNYYFARAEIMLVNPHLWTLAVEEQFYLFWPWLVLFVPSQRLLGMMTAAVLLGPLSRIICVLCGLWGGNATMPMTSNLDTLAMGGLLAVCVARDADGGRRARQLTHVCLWAGLPLLLAYLVWHNLGADHWRPGVLAFRDISAGMFFTWVVFRASAGYGGVAGAVLSHRAMTYLGKISYGLYIYHFHTPGLLRNIVLPRLGLAMPETAWARFLLISTVAIGIAMLSWHLIEKPLNGLKRHFPYGRRSLPAPQRAHPLDRRRTKDRVKLVATG